MRACKRSKDIGMYETPHNTRSFVLCLYYVFTKQRHSTPVNPLKLYYTDLCFSYVFKYVDDVSKRSRTYLSARP